MINGQPVGNIIQKRRRVRPRPAPVSLAPAHYNDINPVPARPAARRPIIDPGRESIGSKIWTVITSFVWWLGFAALIVAVSSLVSTLMGK